MAESPEDLRSGLVFPSLENDPGRRRRIVAFVCVVVMAGLALVWPVYPLVSGVRPYILGLPVSLAWIVGWLTTVFVALVLLYRSEMSSNG